MDIDVHRTVYEDLHKGSLINLIRNHRRIVGIELHHSPEDGTPVRSEPGMIKSREHADPVGERPVIRT